MDLGLKSAKIGGMPISCPAQPIETNSQIFPEYSLMNKESNKTNDA